MTRRLLAPALAVLSLALMGCPPKYPKCDKDEQCKEHNEVCVNGMCQECGKDQDCKPGFVCRDNKCTVKPECTADGDCGLGFKCRNQKCVAECESASDCPPGQQCRSGRCAPAPECSSDADCGSGRRCDASGRCTEALDMGGSACVLQTVYFGFDQYSLTPETTRALDKNADCLKQRRGAVTLAGNCDERGTEEYNLHLGERRANAVKKYLSALGVEPGGLKTISYGKERPVDPGHDEAAWAKNRNVQFEGGR
jgi:peptidoglycan-associated lipoprotein